MSECTGEKTASSFSVRVSKLERAEKKRNQQTCHIAPPLQNSSQSGTKFSTYFPLISDTIYYSHFIIFSNANLIPRISARALRMTVFSRLLRSYTQYFRRRDAFFSVLTPPSSLLLPQPVPLSKSHVFQLRVRFRKFVFKLENRIRRSFCFLFLTPSF